VRQQVRHTIQQIVHDRVMVAPAPDEDVTLEAR
jgi:hypothetical protein